MTIDAKGGRTLLTRSELTQMDMGNKADYFAKMLKVGVEAVRLLPDSNTWQVQLPKATLGFSEGEIHFEDETVSGHLPLSIEPELWETATRERCIVLAEDSTEEGHRRLFTVTAGGDITYNSDAKAEEDLPRHLRGGRQLSL